MKNNTDLPFDLTGWSIRALVRNEYTDPADLERVDVLRKAGGPPNPDATGPSQGSFFATFVFPKGCVLGPCERPNSEVSGGDGRGGKSGRGRGRGGGRGGDDGVGMAGSAARGRGGDGGGGRPSVVRVWHPSICRSYADSEVLRATFLNEITGELRGGFDSTVADLTWLPPRDANNPDASLAHGEGAHGTSWLDPMVRRDHAAKDFLRRAIKDPELRDSLPELPCVVVPACTLPCVHRGCAHVDLLGPWCELRLSSNSPSPFLPVKV